MAHDEGLRLGLMPGAHGMALATGTVMEPYAGAGYVLAPPGKRRTWEDVIGLPTLPGRTWSLSATRVAELRCTTCRKPKLAAFGATCAHCGGTCQ